MSTIKPSYRRAKIKIIYVLTIIALNTGKVSYLKKKEKNKATRLCYAQKGLTIIESI